MLDKFGKFVVKTRFIMIGIFLALAIASVVMMLHVNVNYNMVKYLPENSKTKISLNMMESEFGSVGTASVMLSGVDEQKAKELSSGIASLEGVGSTIFDGEDESYYNKDEQKALIKVFLSTSDYDLKAEDTLNSIKAYLSNELNDYSLSGGAVNATNNRNAASGEMIMILLVAVVIVLAILFLTSKSYIEPLIFLIVIGIAILINMGTNLFLGEISFITKSISSVMLIALEMDYSIVLLHRFREEKAKRENSLIAMEKAISGSFMAVVSSSLTVMAGLVALMFMDFSIGFDVGMVLAKGVFISILAVIFFMPAVILLFDKLIDKTSHRSFLPSMKKVGVFAKKTRYIMPAIFLCLVVGAVILQSSVTYTYVIPTGSAGSIAVQNEKQIEKYFGKQNPLVVMLDKDDKASQKEIATYIVNFKDENGQNVINSASALILTGAFDTLSASEIAQMGLGAQTVKNIFEGQGKNPISENVYKIDVVKYLAENDGVLLEDLTNTINTAYGTFYNYISKSTAINNYGLTSEEADSFYETNDTMPMCLIAKYIVQNNLSYSTKPAVLVVYNSAMKIYTVDSLKASYSLSDEKISEVYSLLNKNIQTDDLYFYELVKLFKEENLTSDVAEAMQQNFESNYSQFKYGENMLNGENLTRMVFNINLSDDDKLAIEFLHNIEDKLDVLCGDGNYYIASNTYNVIGMSEVFSSDRLKTDLITIIAILMIVLLAFRSISVPILLVLAIQGAIWINLGLTVVEGSSIFFVCYMLAVAIQMGATIDYGILLTDRYIFARRKQNKYEAIKTAIDKSFVTVITSGSILVLACLLIHFLSSIQLISDIGLMIGMGAFISILTILFVLPQLLLIFDKVIEKTTLNTKFLNNNEENSEKLGNSASISNNSPETIIVNSNAETENNESDESAESGSKNKE